MAGAGPGLAIEGGFVGGASATGFCAVPQEEAAKIASNRPPIRTWISATRIFFYKMRLGSQPKSPKDSIKIVTAGAGRVNQENSADVVTTDTCTAVTELGRQTSDVGPPTKAK